MVDLFKLRKTFDFSPQEGRIAALLINEQVVSSRTIAEFSNSSKVHIHHIRKKLKPHNITVQSRANLGYWMEEPDKTRLQSVIEGFPGQGETAEGPPLPIPQPDTTDETSTP